MNKWYSQAADKLNKEAAKVTGQKEAAMKNAVKAALLDFCKQDGEFAQAVAQGGSFPDCMKAVAKGVGNSVSDLEAYRKAVAFYFPGADIQMTMRIDLCASVNGTSAAPVESVTDTPRLDARPGGNAITLNLSDFL